MFLAHELPVQGRRRRVREHGAARADGLAAGRSDAHGPAAPYDDGHSALPAPHNAVAVLQPAHERRGQGACPSRIRRCPPPREPGRRARRSRPAGAVPPSPRNSSSPRRRTGRARLRASRSPLAARNFAARRSPERTGGNGVNRACTRSCPTRLHTSYRSRQASPSPDANSSSPDAVSCTRRSSTAHLPSLSGWASTRGA